MVVKFSIILPAYNGGAYIKECIQSILAQTFTDFNIIILDSGSTDGTVEWLRSLKNEKITLHTSSGNLTIEQNWARIKDVQKNEYMTMIGHDDLLHPDYLKEMDTLIQKHPVASLYQTHFEYIDSKGVFVRNCLPMEEKLQAHEFLAKQMTRKIDSTGTGYLMRSKDFNELGGMPVEYPNLIFSDFQLWLSLMNKSYLAISPAKGFSYRLHQSVSVMTNGMAYQQAFTTYIRFLIHLMKINPDIKRTVELHGRDFLLYNCESLSHRLLKTPVEKRGLRVSGFVKKCEQLAAEFIPGQSFKPLKKFRIWIAKQFDRSSFGRGVFRIYKRTS